MHSELGNLLGVYSGGFNNIDLVYRKKSVDLTKHLDAKEKFREQLDSKLNVKKALEEKLASIRTSDGLSCLEIKYADALATVFLKLDGYKSGLEMESNNIARCIDEKKRLLEERQYHSKVLNAYVEAFSLCKDMIEFFDATIPMYISSTAIVKNLNGLIAAIDEVSELSLSLYKKTCEGLGQVSNFNQKDISLFEGKNGGPKPDFSTDAYIKGLLA